MFEIFLIFRKKPNIAKKSAKIANFKFVLYKLLALFLLRQNARIKFLSP